MTSTLKRTEAHHRLARLLADSPRREVGPRDKVVILSDLHMGAGDTNDDFLHNGALCLDALENYYLARGYTLVLNGDVEELLRVPRASIVKAWADMYRLFERFRAEDKLIWLKGNHEIVPAKEADPYYQNHFDGESVLLDTTEGPLFVFHGHQAGVANSGRFNRLIGWSLRVFAHPLGIGNRTIAHDSVKKFKLEKAVHEFSRQEGVVSIIGHTHRPLFESMSKKESIGVRIDRLCRDFSRAEPGRRARIRRTVLSLRQAYLSPRTQPATLATTVYGELPVPCVFNAGCAVGKRGFTTLEIKNGKIGLVFWSSPERSWMPGAYNEYRPSRCFGKGAYRTILRRDSLSYVFARIQLLGDA